jgi:hypothetical protein
MSQIVKPPRRGFPGSKRERPIVLATNHKGRERLVPLDSYAERVAYMDRVPPNLLGGTIGTDEQALAKITRLAAADSEEDLDELVRAFAPRAGRGREFVRWMLTEAVEAARRAEPVGTPTAIASVDGEEQARRSVQFRLLNLIPVTVFEATAVEITDASEDAIKEAFDNAEFNRSDDAPARRWRGVEGRGQAANTFLALGMNRCLVPGCSTPLARDANPTRQRRRRHYCGPHGRYERDASELAAQRHDAQLEAVAALLNEAAHVLDL